MFELLKKNKEFSIISPMTGVGVSLKKVPDEAFSEEMLGIGAAVAPTDGNIFSPVDGVISDITDTKHAFCITSKNGVEILLHIGINTVNLKGEGFIVLVKAGDTVKAGEKIAEVDLELLKKHELCIETPVLLTEQDKYAVIQVNDGKVEGGSDILFTYKKI